MTSNQTRPEPQTLGKGTGSGRPTIGSLCTGYGGLDDAVRQVLDGELAWVADNDPAAARVLAHHHPDVPNLDDITATDWAAVEPVDILAAGFPCQDISYAGLGAGITEGTRSGLWYCIADAIGVLRPRLVVLENVRGIVARRPGLDVVLASLARLGFDARWTCLRASDVGAPHARARWFLVAHPTNLGHERSREARGRRTGPAHSGLAPPDADGQGRERQGPAEPSRRPVSADGSPADSTSDGRNKRWSESAGQQGRPDVAVGGAPAGVAVGGRLSRHQERDSGPVRAQGRHEQRRVDPLRRVLDWGNYAAAVERWTAILGRPAPAPTQSGTRGGQRLSPAFVEWIMGLPAGHVTEVPGLSYGQQLRLLGNGVVPRQGAAALRQLLATEGAVA